MAEVYFPNLVAELARLNMSKPQLAKESGMALTTLYGKLKGETKWSLKDMEKIRDILENYSEEEFTLDYLFTAQSKSEKN